MSVTAPLNSPWQLTADGVGVLGTTVCVWAHPDDETYLAGGLMLALRHAGHRVVCVTATRGEAGLGAEEADTPQTRAALAHLRERELAAALGQLGVQEHHWLGYPDGGCAAVDRVEATARLAEILARVRPDTVVGFGPDGFTGHPDHRAVAGWTERAVARAPGGPPRLLQAVLTPADREAFRDLDDRFGVYALGEPRLCTQDELAVRVQLAGDRLARKVAALRSQHSQTAALIDAAGAEHFAAWVSTESFADAAPEQLR
jgi:LmbE family N-acetylglucosaminyl deacetylase